MSTRRAAVCFLLLASKPAVAQVRVNPTGVNVNTQGATTTFLTFGGLGDYEPVEAMWCGELVSAQPAIGQRCNPASIFGALPLRYDRSTPSGTNAFSDIMTIPPSVTRRAYQAAAAGQGSAFYYVRRFVRRSTGQEQYVAVTCRLAGGGARTPFALTDVRLVSDAEAGVLHVVPGVAPGAIEARIAYTGTGRLVGRWEVVLPGEDPPSIEDLLTEGSLPREQRGLQRRYTQLGRFNVFFPPGAGVQAIPGPEASKFPTVMEGVYYLLLRIEATGDKEGDSNLGAVGAGSGVLQTGGVAGFPMPVLRYVVGGDGTSTSAIEASSARVVLQIPEVGGAIGSSAHVFSWAPTAVAAHYRFELTSDTGLVWAAVVAAPLTSYRIPPFVLARLAENRSLQWRVVSYRLGGGVLARSDWRRVTFRTEGPVPR